MAQSNILLVGATGNVGTEIVKKLASLQVPFKALVHSDKKDDFLHSIPQAEIIKGDLNDKESLGKALQGIEKAFLLTNSSEKAEALQLNFVEAAQKAGVRHIVKLSQLAASVDSPVRFLRYHAHVENRIKDSGIAYTFLRPNLYMQGLLAFKDNIKNEGKFFAAIGNVGVSVVDVRDIAAVAATSLTQEGHENKTYTLTGPQALTHYEMADIFSSILNKPVSFIEVSPEQMKTTLESVNFPVWQADGLLEDYAHYARGEAAFVDDAVKNVTGTNAIAFAQFAEDYKDLFI